MCEVSQMTELKKVTGVQGKVYEIEDGDTLVCSECGDVVKEYVALDGDPETHDCNEPDPPAEHIERAVRKGLQSVASGAKRFPAYSIERESSTTVRLEFEPGGLVNEYDTADIAHDVVDEAMVNDVIGFEAEWNSPACVDLVA